MVSAKTAHFQVLAAESADADGELARALHLASASQAAQASRLRALVQQNLCLLGFFSEIQPF